MYQILQFFEIQTKTNVQLKATVVVITTVLIQMEVIAVVALSDISWMKIKGDAQVITCM